MSDWPKGVWVPYPLREKRDGRTGRVLTKVTNGEGDNKPLYFNKKHFTGGGRYLVFCSNRTGSWQVFACDRQEQRVCRLSDCADDPNYPLVDSMRPWVYFTEGQNVWRVNIETQAEELIYTHPHDNYGMFRLQDISDDGQYIGLVEIERYEGWDAAESVAAKYARRLNARPMSRFWLMTSDGAKVWLAHEERRYLYHLQFRPGDPTTLLYCHEGTASEVEQRMWLMRWDGSDIRPLRPHHRRDVVVVHEYWRSHGRSVVYLYYCPGASEPWSVREIEIASGRETVLDVFPFHDIASDPSGRYLVGDDPKTLWLFDQATGARTPLADHGQSIGLENQPFHAHPQFSPDGKWIDFSFKDNGANDVCLVNVEDLAQ